MPQFFDYNKLGVLDFTMGSYMIINPIHFAKEPHTYTYVNLSRFCRQCQGPGCYILTYCGPKNHAFPCLGLEWHTTNLKIQNLPFR